ncbi:hypothetical protein IF1G_04566 [Cordyceps javanica]|uniref:Uncharacterized protein n=1 Tax=Cordyceps javanica TaxID=43265 RepID=A0A545V6I1_9HYPO|nr:hypothetical protein IF1G_04566 [Cordyceps javanica]
MYPYTGGEGWVTGPWGTDCPSCDAPQVTGLKGRKKAIELMRWSRREPNLSTARPGRWHGLGWTSIGSDDGPAGGGG